MDDIVNEAGSIPPTRKADTRWINVRNSSRWDMVIEPYAPVQLWFYPPYRQTEAGLTDERIAQDGVPQALVAPLYPIDFSQLAGSDAEDFGDDESEVFAGEINTTDHIAINGPDRILPGEQGQVSIDFPLVARVRGTDKMGPFGADVYPNFIDTVVLDREGEGNLNKLQRDRYVDSLGPITASQFAFEANFAEITGFTIVSPYSIEEELYWVVPREIVYQPEPVYIRAAFASTYLGDDIKLSYPTSYDVDHVDSIAKLEDDGSVGFYSNGDWWVDMRIDVSRDRIDDVAVAEARELILSAELEVEEIIAADQAQPGTFSTGVSAPSIVMQVEPFVRSLNCPDAYACPTLNVEYPARTFFRQLRVSVRSFRPFAAQYEDRQRLASLRLKVSSKVAMSGTLTAIVSRTGYQVSKVGFNFHNAVLRPSPYFSRTVLHGGDDWGAS